MGRHLRMFAVDGDTEIDITKWVYGLSLDIEGPGVIYARLKVLAEIDGEACGLIEAVPDHGQTPATATTERHAPDEGP